jgi:adenylate cyclase
VNARKSLRVDEAAGGRTTAYRVAVAETIDGKAARDETASRRAMTRAEVAERAGVSAPEIDELIQLGMLVPGPLGELTEVDAKRATILRTMREAGLPMEGLASAFRTGALSLGFIDTAAYGRFATYSPETFAAASFRTGVPIELLLSVRETLGAAPPKATDRLRDDELPILEWIAMQHANGFRPGAIASLLRAMGDSLRRIAESEAEWWRSEVIGPRLQAGGPLEEAGTPEFSDAMAVAGEQAILSMYHALQMRTWTGNIVAGAEVALQQAGLVEERVRQPAIVFLDITGYTQLTDERGDDAAAQLAEQLGRIVQRTSVAYGGRPVKFLGDGVMFVFPEPGPAVLASLEMVESVAAEGLPPAHVGIAAGSVIFQEGDYYGQTVNLAARISDFARPGEVLVSGTVVDAAGLPEDAFVEVGPVELKGVSGPVRLLAARRSTDAQGV